MKNVIIYFNGGVKTTLSDISIAEVKRLIVWIDGDYEGMFEISINQKGDKKFLRKEGILFVEVENA